MMARVWQGHQDPMDTQDLNCIKVVPAEEGLQDLHH